MFDLGFGWILLFFWIIRILNLENQVKSIADHIRPDRQCLVFRSIDFIDISIILVNFSATMKTKIEKLVVHALFFPIKIVCGDIGEANSDVAQTYVCT